MAPDNSDESKEGMTTELRTLDEKVLAEVAAIREELAASMEKALAQVKADLQAMAPSAVGADLHERFTRLEAGLASMAKKVRTHLGV